MHFSWLALVPAVLAAPLAPLLEVRDASVIPGKFIVTLKDGADDTLLDSTIASVTSILGASPENTYSIGAFKGFSISASDTLLNVVRGLGAIKSIEPDSIVTTNAVQQNPPYGLARISHREKGATTYEYDDSAGAGTFAYIIDTGVRVTHQEFEGRATFGANFAGDGLDTDGNGHGTHVAGTTAGKTYGVAKKASIIAVKVLDSEGTGSNANVLAGIDWAVKDAKAKGRVGKAVANLSLGGLVSLSTNDAANEAIKEGLFLAVAAGNSGLPTITSSPASAESVCTVGASDKDDNRASFSNFGLLVDIFAPGVDVLSAWKDSDTATNTISGTSMATPHITGLGAYLLALEGARDPVALCSRIKDLSTKGALSLPLGSNSLAYNGSGK